VSAQGEPSQRARRASNALIQTFAIMVMAKVHGVHYSCGSTPLLGAISSVGVPAEKCTPRNFAITIIYLLAKKANNLGFSRVMMAKIMGFKLRAIAPKRSMPTDSRVKIFLCALLRCCVSRSCHARSFSD